MSQPPGPTAQPEPSPTSSEPEAPPSPRRLDRAPGERLVATTPVAVPVDAGSPIRAIAMGAVGAAIGGVVFLVLAIGFAFTAGLLVVALFIGRFVGLFVRAGAGQSLSSPARVVLAVVTFLVAMAAAIVTTWLWSHAEGGDLSLSEYLDQVYGPPLIALEFMVGTLMAWWSAR
jgi:hypothetical protein